VREASTYKGAAADDEMGEYPEKSSLNDGRTKLSTLDSSNILYQIEKEGMDGVITSEELMEATEPRTLPFVNYHEAALLFVDISGFTKISQTLELDPLSEVSFLSDT
jgi:class 3 adenylate cyclase